MAEQQFLQPGDDGQLFQQPDPRAEAAYELQRRFREYQAAVQHFDFDWEEWGAIKRRVLRDVRSLEYDKDGDG